jgi:hypothetical protein
MTKLVTIAFAVWMMLAACATPEKTESRSAMRGDYKNTTLGNVRMKLHQQRMERDNYKQRKKMDKAAKKSNRTWDRNDLGNVFGF